VIILVSNRVKVFYIEIFILDLVTHLSNSVKKNNIYHNIRYFKARVIAVLNDFNKYIFANDKFSITSWLL